MLFTSCQDIYREVSYIWISPGVLLHLLLNTDQLLHSLPPAGHGHVFVVGIVVRVGNIDVEQVVVVVLIYNLVPL